MAWQDVARVVAPTIATGLLGPLGGIVATIAGGFLFPPETDKAKLTTQDVVNKIAMLTDPADIAKLQQAEQAVRQFEADNNFRFAQLESAGLENARTMRVGSLASGNKTADRLAWVTLISFLSVTLAVLTVVGLLLGGVWTPTANQEVWVAVSGLIGSILGYFSSNATQVVGFYFGSSSGSAAKSDQLAQHASDALAVLGRNFPPAVAPVTTKTESPEGTTTTTTSGTSPAVQASPSDAAEAAVSSVAESASDVDARWQRCSAFVLQKEGGFDNIRDDHGGPTKLGITQETLARFRGRSVSVEDVQALRADEAKQIYKTGYWDAVRGDELPAGVDLCAFDTCVLCGPKHAVEFLQTASGLRGNDVDGSIGNRTLAAAHAIQPNEIIGAFADRREQFHRSRVENEPSQEKFLKGWLNRVNDLKIAALRMAEG